MSNPNSSPSPSNSGINPTPPAWILHPPHQSTVQRTIESAEATSPALAAASSDTSSTLPPATDSISTSSTSAPGAHQPQPQPTASERLQQARAAVSQEIQLQRAHEPSRLPEMGKVVMTACAELQADMLDCIYNGSMYERATLCQKQSVRFWKCAEDYKHVLKRMGYQNRGVRDEQREVMVREANRIVQHAWKMDDEADVLAKFFAVSLDAKSGKMY